MFRCDLCGKVTAASEPCTKLVLERKRVMHPRRKGIFRRYDDEKRRWVWAEDPGGSGVQIVKQANACLECAKQYQDIDQ